MTKTFKHDSVFWIVSLQGAVFGFFMGGFGPSQPLLQQAQGTSGAVAGLHGTALGVSSLIAGLINSRLVHRFGRVGTSWLGMVIFFIGGLTYALAPSPYVSIPASFLIGIGVSAMINSMTALLAVHYGPHAGRATSQSNGINSLSSMSGTFFVGLLATASLDWRLGLLLPIPCGIALYFLYRHKVTDEEVREEVRQSGKLGKKFWIGWLGLTACISTEFATGFWAASLLTNRTGLSTAVATTAVLAFSSGMAVGRWFSPIVLAKFDLDHRLLLLITIQLFGFILFWSSHQTYLAILGLHIVGLGVSAQFAMATLRLVRLSDNRPDLALGMNAFGAGIAIAGAPLILGALSDSIGISRGYLMVPILIAIAMLTVRLTPTHKGQDA
ncbi:MAG: MFS transporter [Candidatus Nanopelagicaceae bacterium]